MLDRIANITWRRPKLVLALVAAFVVVAGTLGRGVEDHLKPAGFTDSASESERATALLRDELGYDPNPGIVLLVRDRGGGRLDIESPAVRREVDRISEALASAKHVGRVVNPLEGGRGARSLVARDGRSIVVLGQLSTQDVEAEGGEAAEDARRRIGSSPLDVGMAGFAAGFNEVNDQAREDLTKAELIAFPLLAILLLVVFRAVVAAAIPLAVGVISIVAITLVLRVMAELFETSLFAQNIAVGLSLGLAIDYGLLLVSRYREELERLGPTREAHRRTVATAGRTVLFSGFTVAAALIGLVLFPQRFLYSLAVAGAFAAVLSALVAVFVIPSLLAMLGERVNALSIRRGPAVSDESGGWYRLARGVMRRPVAVALGSSVLLLAVSLPLFSANLTGPNTEDMPRDLPAYEVSKRIEASYGRAIAQAITVTVQGGVSDAQLRRLSGRIEAIDGIGPGTAFVRAGRRTAYANFEPEAAPVAASSQDAVDELRSLAAPGGAELLVSGNTARFIDEKESLIDHAPVVAVIVAGATLVLLFMLTGSILLPLKTLLMNTLTLAAALGILVLSFQEGWLKAPLDYSGPEAIEINTHAFLVAIVFGLATDYAVLVMARIKEQHDRGATNEEAVATGMARTGRVVTAAAVLIAVVFMSFAVSSSFLMKQVALGQAVGVLVDATIVRALLVPALMRLFGDWNWWAPAPLKRVQRRYGFHEA
ncbi:MAG TPA: MMPL family transporter [Thermoleophilaceae bacterium]|nr:MMPL family transporter [Thermoleophilaceae bacterium]